MGILRNNFNGGAINTALTTANSGGTPNDAFNTVQGGVQFYGDNVHSSSLSMGFPNGGELSYVSWSPNITAAGEKIACRGYVRFPTTNSGGNLTLVGPLLSSNGSPAPEFRVNSLGQPRLYLGTATPSTNIWAPPDVLPNNTWLRYELKLEQGIGTTDGKVQAAIYNADSPTSLLDTGGWLTGLNLYGGTGPINRVRWGRQETGTVVTGVRYDDLEIRWGVDYPTGWIGATDPQLAAPVVTVTAKSNPTTIGGTNGSITVSWPAVAGANHYEAGIASGNVSSVTTSVTNAVSPLTFSGLGAGTYTIGVRAMI